MARRPESHRQCLSIAKRKVTENIANGSDGGDGSDGSDGSDGGDGSDDGDG